MEIMMSLINTEVKPFKAQAFQNGQFIEVTEADLKDTHFTHKAWHDSSEEIKKIEYVMVGDPTWVLAKNFEVLIESAGLADRGTFVIDPEGKIQIIEINAGGIGRDASELLRKVKAAQYVHGHPGEVCPAKWKEGDATLAPSIDLVGKI
ncbi:hypothetical protein FQR65_LT18783 [Abscondita terminalis]|nr:hypothetical protein FQR65_LT18783 [Abscondita terminalis]